ncbi:(2,3-dihydroxybenzoyl)adenylate synthase, partial [Mycobacterium sp. CBMA361]|nr:(2,3-dihydroxybenzoyl)adenylate synthase [Mycolicibacterium sp. CBMA 361]
MTRTTASTEAEQHLLTGFVPFPDDRADHYRTAGYWSGKSLESLLKDAAQHWPNRVAVIDTTASHTF